MRFLSVARALGYCQIGHGLSGGVTASEGQRMASCGGVTSRHRVWSSKPPGAAVGGGVIVNRAVRRATTERGLGQGDH